MKVSKYFRFIQTVLVITLVIGVVSIPALAQEKKITIKVSTHQPMGGIFHQLLEKFKELVEKRSNGRVKVEVYPGAQLGQEVEAMEGVLMGTLNATTFSPSFLMDSIDGFGVDSLPGLFVGFEETTKMLNDSPIGQEMAEKLLKKGGRILGWLNLAGRHMVFTKKDVKTLKDMEGLRMRSPEDGIRIATFRALNTLPVPVTMGEVYTAFQAGLADGFDMVLSVLVDMKFYEVTKYVLLTDHSYGIQVFVMNEKFFQGLPKDVQQIVIQAGKEAMAFANQRVVQVEATAIKSLKEKGMVFHDFSKEERAKFNSAMRPVIEKWAIDHKSTDFIKRIQDYQSKRR
ncbi:MAG: hypothetical protein A3G35_20365 [candidate division NC10 bacterium RIFCSPLOWO2_12_FULL_66_18]|nr:MAG: hypothetical protein A3H39_10760 [candidate division NC10 bacterium RIFCSPLOWO2_02_FULL_66_22]OGB96327.1 MAG: hypothetical protein A3G35_20365 [candidate division NC10 bacterium RIFCSPLOWO2_12_FULL_66_18]